MDEKSNLYVFEKKEIFLLFLFMILIALTSFVFGVKMGKNYSYKSAGLTTEDRTNVDLLSGQEEDVNNTLEKTNKVDEEELRKAMHESLKKKIMDEMTKNPAMPIATPSPIVTPIAEVAETAKETASNNSDKFTGKFTIQLSSHRSKDEATEFSNGFTARGYDPIVNEVELKGKGTWYRVSLGVFDNVSEAKEYILKEKELFQGQDYVIGRFD
ncbi:MAG: SPOR domain-containing protein [Bacteriovoracaceae bacterium]|jgi:septal ring-binding cell division protein DamX|nr:SPOR domain-containing protein [Bacteriovoracaceae bacterium]